MALFYRRPQSPDRRSFATSKNFASIIRNNFLVRSNSGLRYKYNIFWKMCREIPVQLKTYLIYECNFPGIAIRGMPVGVAFSLNFLFRRRIREGSFSDSKCERQNCLPPKSSIPQIGPQTPTAPRILKLAFFGCGRRSL